MSKFRWLLPLVTSGLLVALASCGGKKTYESIDLAVKPSDSASVKTAKETWSSLCATCHGPTGHGDGPAGQALVPKPRSFSEPGWQDSVTDAHIRKIILEGGAAVGKSPLMTGAPHLKGDPKALDFLVKIVRSLGNEPAK